MFIFNAVLSDGITKTDNCSNCNLEQKYYIHMISKFTIQQFSAAMSYPAPLHTKYQELMLETSSAIHFVSCKLV